MPPTKYLSHLSKIVKVVFSPFPPVVGLQAVRLVGNVPRVKSLTVVELSFEKLQFTE